MNFFSLNHAMSILLSVRLSRGKVRRPPTTVVFVIQSDYTTSFEVLLFAVFSFSASTGWLHCIFLSFAVLVPDMLWSNCHWKCVWHKGTVGCVGLYSDVSKVGNVKKPGRHFDKRDIISAWLNF